MIRFSLPLVPSGMGVFLNAYADRVVIQRTRSLADLGIYGVGFPMGDDRLPCPRRVPGGRNAAVPSPARRVVHTRGHRGASSAFSRRWGWESSSPCRVCRSALRLLAAAPYQRASNVVPLLVLSSAFAGMYMFAPGLAIAKDMVTMAKVTAAAGVANLLLAFALVPPFGIVERVSRPR
jgi:hypothetical protein